MKKILVVMTCSLISVFAQGAAVAKRNWVPFSPADLDMKVYGNIEQSLSRSGFPLPEGLHYWQSHQDNKDDFGRTKYYGAARTGRPDLNIWAVYVPGKGYGQEVLLEDGKIFIPYEEPKIRRYEPEEKEFAAKPRKSPRRKGPVSKIDLSKVIFFYEKDKPYYELTNLWENKSYTPIFHFPDEKTGWKSSEHYFQAMKFAGTPHYETLRKSRGGRILFDKAQELSAEYGYRKDWHEKLAKPFGGRSKNLVEFTKDAVMLRALVEKFTQNEYLQRKLLATGNKQLVENAGKHDNYWGNGAKGNVFDYAVGQNKLGRMLGYVRHAIQNDTIDNVKKELSRRGF